MDATLTVERGVDYGVGEVLDLYRPTDAVSDRGELPVVLLWHGVGVAERHVLEPLARAVAAYGALVVVPDWRSTARDRGRSHLLGSLGFARERAAQYGGNAERFVLGGWSRGARAGAALTLHPEIVDGWRPSAFVGIAGGYDVRPDGKNPAAPTTGTVPLDDAAAADGLEPVPIWLVHGTADASVPIADSRKLAATLTGHGWPVRLHEIEGADHSAVVWADVVDETGRSRAGATEAARRAGTTTAALVGEALSASA